jgi:hypothetical protein
MANVMLTFELLHIQRASSEEMPEADFAEIEALYDEIAKMESALRSHNMMKMAVYGILNKQSSKASALQHVKYVFAIEGDTVRYYLLGEPDEPEGEFKINQVYEVTDRDAVTTGSKKGKLERLATLGMGSAQYTEEEAAEFKYAFRVAMVAAKQEATNPAEAAPAAEGVGEAPLPTGWTKKESTQYPGHFFYTNGSDTTWEHPGAAAQAEEETDGTDKKKTKLGSKALGFGKKAAKKAQQRAQAVASEASKQVQSAVTGAELQDDDIRGILRGKLIGGLGNLKELASQDIYCVAPDDKSLALWKTALLPLRRGDVRWWRKHLPGENFGGTSSAPDAEVDANLASVLRGSVLRRDFSGAAAREFYHTSKAADQLELPDMEQWGPEPEPAEGEDGISESKRAKGITEWAPAPEGAEWASGYAVLYKTVVMLFTEQGDLIETVPLWRIAMPAGDGGAQLRVETSSVQLVFEFSSFVGDQAPAEQAADWLAEILIVCSVALRKDPAVVAAFVKAEETRLWGLEQDAKKAQESSKLEQVVGKLGETVAGQEDGVRKGIKTLGAGFVTGVNDIVKESSKGLKKDGTQGLIKGLSRGAKSLGSNTAKGVAGLGRNVVEGVVATADAVIDTGATAAGATTGAVNHVKAMAAKDAPEVVSRMAMVKSEFDYQHARWREDSIELAAGKIAKLLDDESDPRYWKVSVNGQEGWVPPDCLIPTHAGGSGDWAGSTPDHDAEPEPELGS